MAKTTKRNIPPCIQCNRANAVCNGKTRGPGCWRCAHRKMGCSLVGGASRKKKSEEKDREGSMDLGVSESMASMMVDLMTRVAESLEEIAEGQTKLIKEQRGYRKAMEEWLFLKQERREREDKAIEDEELEGEEVENDEVEDLRADEAENGTEEMDGNEGDKMVE